MSSRGNYLAHLSLPLASVWLVSDVAPDRLRPLVLERGPTGSWRGSGADEHRQICAYHRRGVRDARRICRSPDLAYVTTAAA